MIIKIDISNVLNTTCRALTLDVHSGCASRDYAGGLKEGQAIPTCETLTQGRTIKVISFTVISESDNRRHLLQ